MGKIFFVLFLAAGMLLAHKTPPVDNMATLEAFLEAVNTKERSAIRAFVEKSFASGADSAEVWTDRLLGLGGVAPLKVESVLSEKPNTIVVRLAGKEGELEMRMDFQASEPHRITGIRIGGPGSQSGPPPKEYSDWKSLDELLLEVRKDNGVPAMSVAYFHDGRSGSAVDGVRESGRDEKAQPGDRWLIGSITKSMTAMAIASLVDQGRLRWDTTLQKALPGTPMREAYKKVTILQLLRHRGGITQDLNVTPAFIDAAAGHETDPVKVREHYARFTLAKEPIGKPGEKMTYSNAGYSIAGHIAEIAAKKPFEQVLKELVFEPLEMKSAWVGVPGTKGNPGSPGNLMGHVRGEKGLQTYALDDPRMNAMFAPAGAGVAMTVDDLLRYAVYHLRGLRGEVRILSKSSFDLLHEPVGPERYGCGWSVTAGLTAEPFQGHNGSDGTFHAQMAIWKDRNLAVVSIMNMGSLAEMAPTMQVVKALYRREASEQNRGHVPLPQVP